MQMQSFRTVFFPQVKKSSERSTWRDRSSVVDAESRYDHYKKRIVEVAADRQTSERTSELNS